MKLTRVTFETKLEQASDIVEEKEVNGEATAGEQQARNLPRLDEPFHKYRSIMNPLIESAGIIALLTTIGHFTLGRKMYLKPLMESDIDDIPKKVLHCLFHYASTFFILSTFALFVSGSMQIGRILCLFIAANYALFSVWHLVLVKQSGIDRGPVKLFQWIFFVLIAVLSSLGVILWNVF